MSLLGVLSATPSVAELLGAAHPLNFVYALLGWLLLGLELDAGVTVEIRGPAFVFSKP